MISYCHSNVGQQRSENEDAARCASLDDGRELVVVADGMGGHSKGAEASATAVERLFETVTSETPEAADRPEDLLERGFRAAHDAVTDLAAGERKTPGTTLVAALVADDTATIANVGDSRAYYVDEELRQVTTDQSQVQELVEAGEITPEEASNHPMSHVLSQAIGTADDLDVDLYTQSISEGWLLLCTDGLTDPVPEDAIEATCLDATSLEAAGTDLIREANDRGGPDNVTVGLCRTDTA
ncbi:PP2C family serine/threonine-protein phosphatase (plasmid) [Halomicrobium sp. HM KBTZ05]|uniref:PP2C family protein-serine/threonine phosphatase n=1 Tax=Halomicrobium sp. HM KBTZ05 TaxID=3242663 RepID=UPI003556ACD5